VRIGFNILLRYHGTESRLIPNKLNLDKLYNLTLRCEITADKMAVDLFRHDF
jgi:hypothetical protein